MGSSSSKSNSIEHEVQEYPVVIYTKPSGNYSKMAKELLGEEKLFFVEKDLTVIEDKNPSDYEAYFNSLVSKTNVKTVPQIFICGKFVGGYDDLNKLKIEKQLWKLVEPCKEQYKNIPEK